MSIYTPIIQGIYLGLPAGPYSATQEVLGSKLIDPTTNTFNNTGIYPEASGIIAYLMVTQAAGAGETLRLILQEQDPISGNWSDVAGTLAQTNSGMIKLKIKQAISNVAASATQVQYQDTLPAIWRLRVAHSGAGTWAYSLGVVLYA